MNKLIDRSDRIFLAGHRGLVGSAMHRALVSRGYQQVLVRTHAELDLTDQAQVRAFFRQERPDHVILAAAKVGGILANSTQPGDFIGQNLLLQSIVIHAAYEAGVRRLLFLGSSCIYPRLAPQPMREDVLLTGPLEATNEPYAVAKIAGIKMCADFLSVMPTNLYGPGDNYDLQTSHVMAALIRKMHEASLQNQPAVTVWGTGEPRREFLHCEDMADACLFLLENVRAAEVGEIVNVGVGADLSIRELAELIARIVGYTGALEFDVTKPDGTPRKLLDVSRLRALGWSPRIDLEAGVRGAYEEFRKRYGSAAIAA
jgi:GDP-L-fucose synthase